MRPPPIKQDWISRCIDVYNYHVTQNKTESNWTIEKTALTLCRSIGSVSQDILLASWMVTHEKQLRRFRSAKDALDFIRKKKREIKTREIEL